MIRRVAKGVMLVALVVLVGNLFIGKPVLVGNAVATLCDDSDLKEVNDPLNGVVFLREQYSTLNYALPGTARGLHSLLKIPVTIKDNCVSSTKLREYYCDLKNNLVASSLVSCPANSLCNEGACVPLVCNDLDGFNLMKSSSIQYTSASGSDVLSADDYCESSTTIVEFVCRDAEVTWPGGIKNSYDYSEDLRRAVHSVCPTGTECKDGACKKV